MPSRVQVFILTCNRPGLVGEAVKSILRQNHPDFHVMVSNNSTSNETETLCKEIKHPLFSYHRRVPPLPPLEHFNTIIREAEDDLFMMFHDDDRMMQGCLQRLATELDRRPTFAAIVGNAYFLRNGRVSNQKFVKRSDSLIVPSSLHLLMQYLVHGQFAPFPAYVYRRSLMREARLSKDSGGKYSDVAFLMEVASGGPLLFIPEPVMEYRIHGFRDTSTYCMADRQALFRFIFRTTSLSRRHPGLLRWRIVALESWYLSARTSEFPIFHADRWRTIQALKLRIMPFPFFADAVKAAGKRLFSRTYR